jgi:hypothetical protein
MAPRRRREEPMHRDARTDPGSGEPIPPTAAEELFEGRPTIGIEAWLGLGRRGRRSVMRNASIAALIAALVAWAPLALLSALRGEFVDAAGTRPFLLDVAVHARCLVALPMLILPEAICLPRLGAIARHFAESGLLSDADRPRFDAAVASTRRLRDSKTAEIAVVLAAYALALLLLLTPEQLRPAWSTAAEAGLGGRSLAGWWHTLVSLPMLLVLVLGWGRRVALWARFLWLVSRLDLRLLPSHPDRVGGLRFAGHSLRAFASPAFGLGAIVAGAEANRLLHADGSPIELAYVALGSAVFVVILFASPLLAFSGKLLAHWHRGVLAYGSLATRVGREFERRWLEREESGLDERARDARRRDPLESSAFSATTDLYQVVSNVYAMHVVPIDVPSVALLIAATLLPLLPVLLLVAPVDDIARRLAGLLI